MIGVPANGVLLTTETQEAGDEESSGKLQPPNLPNLVSRTR